MENKFNVLDPVLVYATIDAVNHYKGKIVYSIRLEIGEHFEYIDFVSEESIQTVF